jgi:hypothetical protein
MEQSRDSTFPVSSIPTANIATTAISASTTATAAVSQKLEIKKMKEPPLNHRQTLQSLADSLSLPIHYNYRQTDDKYSVQLVVAGMDLRGEGGSLGDVIEAVSEEGIRLVKERVIEKGQERLERKKEVNESYEWK